MRIQEYTENRTRAIGSSEKRSISARRVLSASCSEYNAIQTRNELTDEEPIMDREIMDAIIARYSF